LKTCTPLEEAFRPVYKGDVVGCKLPPNRRHTIAIVPFIDIVVGDNPKVLGVS